MTGGCICDVCGNTVSWFVGICHDHDHDELTCLECCEIYAKADPAGDEVRGNIKANLHE